MTHFIITSSNENIICFLEIQHMLYFLYWAFVITSILHYFRISVLSCNMMSSLEPGDLSYDPSCSYTTLSIYSYFPQKMIFRVFICKVGLLLSYYVIKLIKWNF